MRYLIGIVFGLLIVFNWSTIKSYFDKQIDEQAGVFNNTNKPTEGVQAVQPVQADKTPPAKQDLFKEFK